MQIPRLTYAAPLFILLLGYIPQESNAITNGVFDVTPVSFSVTPSVPFAMTVLATATLDTDPATNYTITLHDSTGGTLDNGTNKMAYSVSYAGQAAFTLTTVPQPVESGSTQLIAAARTIAVAITGPASIGLPAGTYSTTITLTLTAI